MLTLLKNWKDPVEINGTLYDSINAVNLADIKILGEINIKLLHTEKIENRGNTSENKAIDVTEYQITVKRYMTQKASATFDFMEKWNNNIPMPLRTMVGTVEKETRGMVYMKLHGDIIEERVCTCMKCGRVLTNPVSQYFGIGSECGGHNYVHPFDTNEELKAAVDAYKKQLRNITREGWVIKSAITERKEVK